MPTTSPPVMTPFRNPRSRTMQRRRLLVGLVVLIVVAAGISYGVVRARPLASGYGALRTPAVAGPGAVVTVGSPDAPHRMVIYEDPNCPACASFEHRYGQLIARRVDQGRLQVSFQLLNFLDGESVGGSYSTRAASALLCVAQSAGPSWGRFHGGLFEPEVQHAASTGSGRSTDDLVRDARAAGATDPAVESCIRAETFARSVSDVTPAVRREVGGTPNIRLDGRLLGNRRAQQGTWVDVVQ